jgi:hypothetical protein
LNEKNEKSYGYEVLLSGISINGKIVTNEILKELPDGWTNNNGMIIGNGTSQLKLQFEAKSDIKLLFNKHQWSGKVRIIDGNNNKVLDLYSNTFNDYVSTYLINSNKSYSESLYYLRLFIIFIFVFITTQILIKYLFLCWENKVSDRSFRFIMFFALMYLYGIFIIASFPASMCVDSRTQFYQVLGIEQITNNHPAFHTIALKCLITIFKSPVSIAVAQALMLSLVFVFLLKCLQKKINNKILVIFTLLFAISINNGIYVTTVWKDVPFSFSLLWAAVLLLDMINDPYKFISRKRNIAAISIALTFVYLFRHNGVITFIIVEIFLLFILLKFKIKKYVLAILLPLLLIVLIEIPIYNSFNVNNYDVISTGGGTSAPLHGIVYATLYDYSVPKEAEELLENLMPMESWNEVYQAYSSNPLFLSDTSHQYNIENNVADIGMLPLVKVYMKTLVNAPTALIKDRLFGTDLVWNVFKRNGYDWRVANDTYEIGVVDNDFGYYRSDNLLTNIIKTISTITFKNRFLDAVFWRGGFHLCGLLILLTYVIMNKDYKKLSFLLPFIGNATSLGIAMCWQDYRYVYFMAIFFFCFSLVSISKERRSFDNKGTIQ